MRALLDARREGCPPATSSWWAATAAARRVWPWPRPRAFPPPARRGRLHGPRRRPTARCSRRGGRPTRPGRAGRIHAHSRSGRGRGLGRAHDQHPPSLLPKYPGLHTHERALAAGDAPHGASVHYVTAELTAAPVIAQVDWLCAQATRPRPWPNACCRASTACWSPAWTHRARPRTPARRPRRARRRRWLRPLQLASDSRLHER